MTQMKKATLSLRIDPSLKEALRTAAQQDHRSIANMIEVLIRDHCQRNDVKITSNHGAHPHQGEHKA